MQTANVLMTAALLTTMTLVSADVSLQILEPNPKHPGACYDADADEAHAVDSDWLVPGRCAKASCSKDEGVDKFVIQYSGCGAVAPAQPPCKMAHDKKAPYPDCCPKIVCP